MSKFYFLFPKSLSTNHKFFWNSTNLKRKFSEIVQCQTWECSMSVAKNVGFGATAQTSAFWLVTLGSVTCLSLTIICKVGMVIVSLACYEDQRQEYKHKRFFEHFLCWMLKLGRPPKQPALQVAAVAENEGPRSWGWSRCHTWPGSRGSFTLKH